MTSNHYTQQHGEYFVFADFINEGNAATSGPVFDAISKAASAVPQLVIDPGHSELIELLLFRYDKSETPFDFTFSHDYGAQWTTVLTSSHKEAADAAGFCSLLWKSIFVIRLLGNPQRQVPNFHSLQKQGDKNIQAGKQKLGYEFWIKHTVPASHIGSVLIDHVETSFVLRS